jgi:thiol-disulfide isomerase/thioredoxin
MSNISHWRRIAWAAFLLINAVFATAAELEAVTPQAARPLALSALDGPAQDLEAHRGKVVLVNFWATWCEPCREEMPSIQRLHQRMRGKPFTVLLVNVDEPEARVRRYLAESKVDLPVLLDRNKEAIREWGVRVMPTSFLVGADGRTRYQVVGDIDWSSDRAVATVEKLMAEK